MVSDINECLESNGGCDHTCTNNPGSYYCTCTAGFQLANDSHICDGNNIIMF